MKEVIPVAVLAALGYWLWKSGVLSNLASGVATGPNALNVGGTRIKSPVRPGDFPGDAIPDASDSMGTDWQRQRDQFQQQVTVMPTQYRTTNAGGIQDMESITAREGVAANEQLVRASYEQVWAGRLTKTLLPYVEWNRLRTEYVSRFGGQDPAPDLRLVMEEGTLGKLMNPTEYLALVNRYRQAIGKAALSGLSNTGTGVGAWL